MVKEQTGDLSLTPSLTSLALLLLVAVVLLASGCAGLAETPPTDEKPPREIIPITNVSGQTPDVTRMPYPTQNNQEFWIQINPIGDHAINELFSVNGTTNLPAGELLLVQVYSATYKPSKGKELMETSSMKYAEIPVLPGGNGSNTWGTGDVAYGKKDLMIAFISGKQHDADSFQYFNISDAPASQVQTVVAPA